MSGDEEGRLNERISIACALAQSPMLNVHETVDSEQCPGSTHMPANDSGTCGDHPWSPRNQLNH